jgi:hypothetical protein
LIAAPIGDWTSTDSDWETLPESNATHWELGKCRYRLGNIARIPGDLMGKCRCRLGNIASHQCNRLGRFLGNDGMGEIIVKHAFHISCWLAIFIIHILGGCWLTIVIVFCGVCVLIIFFTITWCLLFINWFLLFVNWLLFINWFFLLFVNWLLFIIIITIVALLLLYTSTTTPDSSISFIVICTIPGR